MLRIMLQKLVSKKWMNLCLLLGSVLMVATAVSFPLYQTAAYDRMLRDEFQSCLASEGRWPGINRMVATLRGATEQERVADMEKAVRGMGESLGVTTRMHIFYYLISGQAFHSAMNRTDLSGTNVRLGTLSGLSERAEMISGEMFSEGGLAEDGSIEVVVSEAGLVNLNLLVGETIVLDELTDAEGGEIRLTVKGVFKAGDNSDFYWQVNPENMNNICLMDTELFRQMFTGRELERGTLTCMYYHLFEFEDLKAEGARRLAERTDYMVEEGEYNDTMTMPVYRGLLDSFFAKEERIRATLTILQAPVMIMLAAFLLMISGQMYELEKNEISVIKSRGSSSGQIFRLYLYQSVFLALLGLGFGIPLGAVFSRVLGSARNFLEFEERRALEPVFTREAFAYAGAAFFVTLLIMTLPAIKHSRVTIVGLKRQNALKKKSWWEKIFLDMILLAVSLYAYYSFRRSGGAVEESVVTGNSLDPLLYISSSLFIVGMGLLSLRLQPLFVRLVYTVGKRFWKPASYASFLENLKNGRKQQFIMLFLIMTISLGMYHAAVARTILQNARENTEYLDGADIIIQEKWQPITDEDGSATGEYFEPDYSKYVSLECAEGYTRVLKKDKVYVGSGSEKQAAALMGIHTREFGELTWVPGEFLDKHYYEYLNELAVKENGILVSENFRSKLGYAQGDKLSYRTENGKLSATGVIVDFFDYWPGYAPSVMSVNPDGTAELTEKYLIVTHYDMLRQRWGVQPYEVWMNLKEGHEPSELASWIQENKLSVRKYVDREADVQRTVEDPLLQGTNGVLTMGFLVTILLCAVGYLIYWILSIRSREMIFGVLRACGMHKGELFHMLINEQIFSGLFSVAAGFFVGRLASAMFVPMVQQAYAAANQVLPMRLITDPSDMARLYLVVGGVMAVCLAVLILLLFKLNVAKALKLGEE